MKRAVSILFICALVLLSLTSCRKVGQTVVIDDKPVESDDYVKLMPGVSKEMMNASYWIKEGFNEIIMPRAQIDKFNADNGQLLGSASSGSFCLTDIKDSISGVTVREILSSIRLPADEQFINGARVGAQYWHTLEQNANAQAIPEKVSVRFGFTVVRDTLRQFPTNDYANNEIDDPFYDSFIMSDSMPFSPVAVLHESADGAWYFVAGYCCCGWIEKENVAICPSRSDWLSRQAPDSFLVVTGRELRLSADPYCPELSNLLLPMGTVLPLLKVQETPDRINRRSSFGCYTAKLPIRLSDGSISDALSLIPMGEDVTVGYMEFTRANIINQAFKLQGGIYGWGGDFNSNDCSGVIRQIFRCFGLEFPRTGAQQIKAADLAFTDLTGKNEKEKLDTVLSLTPGSLLYFSGHIMIYLGTDTDGEPYVISSVGSLITEGTAEGEVLQVNTMPVSSLLRTSRKNGKSWLSNLEFTAEIKNTDTNSKEAGK